MLKSKHGAPVPKSIQRELCTREIINSLASSSSDSELFSFKYGQMSFKEDQREKKLSSPLIFWK